MDEIEGARRFAPASGGSGRTRFCRRQSGQRGRDADARRILRSARSVVCDIPAAPPVFEDGCWNGRKRPAAWQAVRMRKANVAQIHQVFQRQRKSCTGRCEHAKVGPPAFDAHTDRVDGRQFRFVGERGIAHPDPRPLPAVQDREAPRHEPRRYPRLRRNRHARASAIEGEAVVSTFDTIADQFPLRQRIQPMWTQCNRPTELAITHFDSGRVHNLVEYR